MTPIDSLYEFAGYKLAGTMQDLLWGVGLPVILSLAGVAYVIHAMSERGSPRDLAVYALTLLLMAWLLSPTTLQEVRTPRFVAYLGSAADLVQRRAAARIHERFLESPFEYERLSAMVSFARILDPHLERETARFLGECAKPALAKAAPEGSNVFRPGTLPYGPGCEDRRRRLWEALGEHVRGHPFHRTALETARRRDPAAGSEFADRYLDEIATRALDDPGSPTGEMALVAASLGEYSYTDAAQSSGTLPWWFKAGVTTSLPLLGIAAWLVGDEAANAAVSGAAVLEQSWSNRFSAKQKYYLATLYGPHVYGLALLLVLGLFPAAGLFAILPGKWRALVHYGEVLVSIKLWPVCWAALSSFNARRGALEAFAPGPRGGTDVFLALASMYLLAPAIAFLVVHLAVSASAVPFGPAVPPAAGPGLGPAGPVIGAAARLAH